MKIGVLQVDGHQPHIFGKKGEDGLESSHPELYILHKEVEVAEV